MIVRPVGWLRNTIKNIHLPKQVFGKYGDTYIIILLKRNVYLRRKWWEKQDAKLIEGQEDEAHVRPRDLKFENCAQNGNKMEYTFEELLAKGQKSKDLGNKPALLILPIYMFTYYKNTNLNNTK